MLGAVIPVGWGLATGERPPAEAVVGVVLAIVAGGLISLSATGSGAAGAISPAPGDRGGAGFGVSFICYGNTTDESEFWPVLAGRVRRGDRRAARRIATPARRSSWRTPRIQAIVAGVLDVVATALLLVAIREGLFGTVAPVAALAPAFTVGNAWWYLRGRPSLVQSAGLVVALVGLVLIAVGNSS